MPDEPDEKAGGRSWSEVFGHWSEIEPDLLERYGVALTNEVLATRTYRWLKSLINGLLSIPPTVVFRPDGAVLTIQATRLGHALNPPELTTPTTAT